MANIPSRWLKYHPDNVSGLRAHCQELCENKGVSQKLLAIEAGGWDQGEFSKWIRGDISTPLVEERYHKLLAHVASTGAIKAEDYDKVFAGIADFLGFTPDDTVSQTANFVGHYIVHRYSLLAPGHILQGSLTIEHDQKLQAFKTKEFYRIQAEILTRIKNQPEKSELAKLMSKVGNLDFARDGYFFPRSPDSYVMISKKSKKRLYEPSEIETTYFDNVFDSDDAPGLMHGLLTDWHKKRVYTTRVVAQRLEDRLSDELVKTLDPSDVNDVANQYLTRSFEMIKYVFSYA
jgi:hypothetical protein